MSDPAVSVLMTVHNAGRFLDPSIRSILNQAFRNFEFLIVDDASTDDSARVAEEWAQKDPRVRVIRNERNKGQTPCLNQGLQLARGRWIARQDADDLSHATRLSEQHQFTTMWPEVVLLGSSGRIIDENDRLAGLLDAPRTHEEIAWSSPLLNPFIHTSVMFRTELVREEFGGYDESFRISQDYDLWTRILAKHKTANLPQRLVAYRHLGTSLSKAGQGRAFAEAEQISRREANRAFGRELDEEEFALLRNFREGLTVEKRDAFWRLYEGLKPEKFPHLTAMHHLKAAGALAGASKGAAAAEILAALQNDFHATAGWLATRYLNA